MLMVALGNLIDALSHDDTCAILDLYTAAPDTCREEDAVAKIPFLEANSGRKRVLHWHIQKGNALSSPEDEQSCNGIPLGEGIGETYRSLDG